MLFDLRGKRKRLIQVIYAMLALLMGGGLIFLGIGGEVSGGLLDAFTDRQGAASGDLVDEAERLEEAADEAPRNEQVLTRLVRARYTAGNSLYEFDEAGGQVLTPEAAEQFELAADAWHQYLRTKPRSPDADVAQLVANAYFALAQGATDGNDARRDAAAAAEAQELVASDRPSVGSLSSLAIYHYFGNDFEAGDAAAERVVELSGNKQMKRRAEQEMQSYRRQAQRFQKELDQYNKAIKAGEESGTAPQLQDPVGGLSGATP